ncbi:hypothetical protein OROHE_000627 [Orobanche hederae]
MSTDSGLPMLVCGDFGIIPRRIEGSHLFGDESRMMDKISEEPLYTHSTKDFWVSLTIYSTQTDSLKVESLLGLLDRNTTIPSLRWPSDHIALLAKFCFKLEQC